MWVGVPGGVVIVWIWMWIDTFFGVVLLPHTHTHIKHMISLLIENQNSNMTSASADFCLH